jgi:hypothetical protein
MASVDTGSPPASGVRLPWAAIPADLRADVELVLGEPIVEATTQPGGFSPGVAARLRGVHGARAFVKAVSAAANPESPDLHRAEARIAAALPVDAPTPRLLASFDRDGWVVLMFEDVAGTMPRTPWEPDELDRVLVAMADLAAALTPAPIPAPTFAERCAAEFVGWRTLAAGPAPDGLDPWCAAHLADLAALEGRLAAASAGDTLLHNDLRADNILLTADRVVIVDWPWACRGAGWIDLLGMLPSVAMQGGPPPWEVFDGHPVAADADPDAVTGVLAALAGYFVHRGSLPPPPGLPTVRAFQLAQGRHAVEWLRRRLNAS